MNKQIKSFLMAFLWSMVAVFGAMGCLVSGFSLDSLSAGVVMCWVLAAAVYFLCFSLRIGLYPMIGLGLLGVFLWKTGHLSLSMEQFLLQITEYYNGAYGWGIIRWSEESLVDISTNTAICWLGLAVVISTIWWVIRCKDVWLAVLTAVLPLLSCMLVTDSVPDALPLYLVLLDVVLLLMTQTVRMRDEHQGNRLVGYLVLPVAAALALLFLFIPRDTYDKQDGAQALEDLVVSWYEDGVEIPEFTIPQFPLSQVTEPAATHSQKEEDPGISGDLVAKQENLALTGPKTLSDLRIMNVTAQYSGTLYLRGAGYDTYSGTTWTQSNSDGETDWPSDTLLEDAGDVTVTTVTAHDVLYLPYYVSEADYSQFKNSMRSNTRLLKEYTFRTGALPRDYLTSDAGQTGYADDMDLYLQLPEETKQWASSIILELFGTESPEASWQTVSQIAAYVQNSARYDLDTPRMEGDDFARWFLEESDTGYCVHFASATAVLLRAAGIPARYVTGYTVSVSLGQETAVTGKNAHAWVEYRLPDKVWCVLESTPADASGDWIEPSAPQQTEPQETLPQQTDPEQTTFPGDPTMPDPTQSPEDSQSPSENTVTGETPSQEPKQTFAIPAWVWVSLLSVLLVPIQWRLRVYLRCQRRHRGRSKARALAAWQEVVLLSKLLKQTPDKALLELAQKAKFSQHAMLPEELKQFAKAISQMQSRLKKKSFLHQLYYTLVLALY